MPADGPAESNDGKPSSPVAGRRTTSRTGLRGPATVALAGGLTRGVEMHDLSLDGLSVMAARPISPGTRCTISFDLPLGEPPSSRRVTAQAKAVYSSYTGADGFKVGMIFMGLETEAQRLIGELLR